MAVGGSRDENNFDISIDDKESKAILERSCKICPSLKVIKNANDVAYWTHAYCLIIIIANVALLHPL